MKKILSVIALAILAFGQAKAQSNTINVGKLVNGNPVLTSNSVDLLKIKTFFSNAVMGGVIDEISLNRNEDNPTIIYLAVSGNTVKGNFVARAEIGVQKDDVLALRGPDVETCAGDNCSQCAFASGGGCECKRTADPDGDPGICNHNITRGGGIIQQPKVPYDYGVVVSPNPTTGLVIVSLGEIYNDVISITVKSNTTQQAVFSKQGSFNRAETINLSANPAGIYTLSLLTDGNITITKLIELIK